MDAGAQGTNTPTSSNRRIPIEIGDVCCSIRCHDKSILRYLQQLYVGFLSDKAADIIIELNIIERFSASNVDSILPPVKFLKWGEQIAAICRVSDNNSASVIPSVNVTLERQQLTPQFEFKVMNTLLPVSYYTVHRHKHRDNMTAMLVHSCSILRKGQLIIFAGPSETGKTTIARLCGSEHGKVVNDEMLLLTKDGKNGGKFIAQGVPIIGGVPQRLNLKAPPTCVMILKQAEKTTIRSLDRVEAYLRFMRQVIAPRDLIEPDDTKAMLTEISRFADTFTKAVPCYELEFTLEKESLWRAVEGVEEALMKGEPAAWKV